MTSPAGLTGRVGNIQPKTFGLIQSMQPAATSYVLNSFTRPIRPIDLWKRGDPRRSVESLRVEKQRQMELADADGKQLLLVQRSFTSPNFSASYLGETT